MVFLPHTRHNFEIKVRSCFTGGEDGSFSNQFALQTLNSEGADGGSSHLKRFLNIWFLVLLFY